jgi:hypothetical protein
MLEDRVIDRYEAARAEELIDWAAACEAMDDYKAKAILDTRARQGGQ